MGNLQQLMAKGNRTKGRSLEMLDKIKETRYLGSQLKERGSRLKQIRPNFCATASHANFNIHRIHLKNLLKSVNLGWRLRFFISNKPPDDTHPDGVRTSL